MNLTRLMRELDTVTDILGPGRRVSHIHFGGGSPSLIAADDWRRLFVWLNEGFAIAGDA